MGERSRSKRKLFCLIKETDFPESDTRADMALEKMATHYCGCGWPDRPCLDMHPDLRNVAAINTSVNIALSAMQAWQRPWNRSPKPRRGP